MNGSLDFLFTSLFYIYNFLVVVFILCLFADFGSEIIAATYRSILMSVIVQMAIYILGGGFSGGRMVGGFNNPNQLGYYALLVLSILVYASKETKIPIKWFVVGIGCSMIVVFASLSKAAILSFSGLLIFFVFTKHRNRKFKRNFTITAVIILIIGLNVYYTTDIIQNNPLVQSVQRRLSMIGSDSDDSLEGRGYDRVTEYPEYWIFGAGEGNYERFRKSMEFHSTLGNLQVSYGIVGLSMFLLLVHLALINNRYQSWYIVLSIMTYGLRFCPKLRGN